MGEGEIVGRVEGEGDVGGGAVGGKMEEGAVELRGRERAEFCFGAGAGDEVAEESAFERAEFDHAVADGAVD